MTTKEVIEQAKKLYDMDITEEQARKWLDAHPDVEQLTDEELDNVSGGLVLLLDPIDPRKKKGPRQC